jgi:arsenite methyltransferase
MKEENVKQIVRERYGRIARTAGGGCGCGTKNTCCDTGTTKAAKEISRNLGYSDEDLETVPEGANLGLGCGNPVALASLREGETVLDLGSGAGFDCFIAARQVGTNGKVIGVDMTQDMLERARANVRNSGVSNVEFRLGEIEHLPVADNSVDAIISNCVINLVPDKPQVFREAFRALRRGGRLMVSDIVLNKELPDEIKDSVEAYASCVAGASMKQDYLDAIGAAGFENIEIVKEDFLSPDMVIEFATQTPYIGLATDLIESAARAIASVKVKAVKP